MKETKNNELNTSEKTTIGFLDILVEFSKNLKLMIRIILIFLLLGLVVAIFRTTNYTATSRVVADLYDGQDMRLTSGLNALRSFGVNLGEPGSGIIPDTYPQIIKSREVLYDVIKTPVYISKLDSTMRLMDYLNHKNFSYYLKKYTIKLPFTIVRLIFPKQEFVKIKTKHDKILYLDKYEHAALNKLMGDIVSAGYDFETGIITISTTISDPILSAQINEMILTSFRKRIRNMYDEKNSDNLKFIKERLEESKEELREAEQRVVEFLERNTNPQTIQLQTELDRLKRDVDFKANLYNELQLRYTQAKLELKKSEPVIKIIERPSPPLNHSSLGRFSILLICIVIGFLIGLVLIFFNIIINSIKQDEKDLEKYNNVKAAFSSIRNIKLFPTPKKK